MSPLEINHFANQHCRFVLKTGKVIYGVIWESKTHGHQYYFASHGEVIRIKKYDDGSLGLPVNPEDIIYAENLAS